MATTPPPKRLQPWPFPLPPPPPPPPTVALGERVAGCGKRRSRERKGSNGDSEDLLGLCGHEFLLSSCWDRAPTARSVIRTCGEARIDDVTVVTGMRFASWCTPTPLRGYCPFHAR